MHKVTPFWGILRILPLFITLGSEVACFGAKQSNADRYKLDILLVVAHPDDETAISTYLAQASLDESKRIGVVYVTRGEKGENPLGPERSGALGAIREIEVRKALQVLGIEVLWFLEGSDTASQDVLQSLGRWHEGALIEDVVRLIRLTRPEVVMTWLPQFVAGENHGDHQAAGVIATEALDLAAQPTAFGYQLYNRRMEGGLDVVEGLKPWQAKKLYFFSDRTPLDVFKKAGPAYRSTVLSASKKIPYYAIAAQSAVEHRTQAQGLGAIEDAVKAGDYTEYLKGLMEYNGTTDAQLILGKALVKCSTTGDVFEGCSAPLIPPAPAPRKDYGGAPTLQLGGAWHFYEEFAHAHSLEGIIGLFSPELGLRAGATAALPLLIQNGAEKADYQLRITSPDTWSTKTSDEKFALEPGEVKTVQLVLTAPVDKKPDGDLICELQQGGKVISSVKLRLQHVPGFGTMPY